MTTTKQKKEESLFVSIEKAVRNKNKNYVFLSTRREKWAEKGIKIKNQRYYC